MMAVAGALHSSHEWGISKTYGGNRQLLNVMGNHKLCLSSSNLSSVSVRRDSWNIHVSNTVNMPAPAASHRCNPFKCCCILNPGKAFEISSMKNVALALTRSYSTFQGGPLVPKLVPAVGLIVFAVWGLGPLMRRCRTVFLHKSDSTWRKSNAYYLMTSYLQPLLLWTGATLICRVLDPVALPSEASQIVLQRLLNFVRSLSTVLAVAYCLSSAIQQAQKLLMETTDSTDTRNMGFQFAGKALYTTIWVAAVSLFMELLGFPTQKWLTAGGLGTVLLTLAGREIFTNFLSSAMIHATRPFVVNEWIQTKIEGYEVSGTVEHVGWWSPTIVRGEDREAVHIPNHKFTVNVVRNLSQKTHWRIKTHLAISHLDVSKINSIVADMRKVLAKNPHVEQQRLHRRVFLENINPENQALVILISCFVKTSRLEEYLCVKEAILLDLLRVIRHHRARLATPIRTIQKIHDLELDNIPFADSIFTHRAAASNRPFLLIEPPYKINGEDRTKSQTRSSRTSGDQNSKGAARPGPDIKTDAKGGAVVMSESKAKEVPHSDFKAKESPSHVKTDSKAGNASIADAKEDHIASKPISDSKSASKTDSKSAELSSLDAKSLDLDDNSAKDDSGNKPREKTGMGNTGESTIDTSPSEASVGTNGEKPRGFSSTPESKQEAEGLPHALPAISRHVLEENMVLGVALEGSKRTLPIDEGTSPPAQAEAKELAACQNGTTSSTAKKYKKDKQVPDVPNSPPSNQRHSKG